METVRDPHLVTKETHAGPALRKHVAEFAELLVRDYLSKQGLSKTLAEMDVESEEIGRTKPTMTGWATMAELIRLTDLLRANEDENQTILEVLAKELARESSVKMRKPVHSPCSEAPPPAPNAPERRSSERL